MKPYQLQAMGKFAPQIKTVFNRAYKASDMFSRMSSRLKLLSDELERLRRRESEAWKEYAKMAREIREAMKAAGKWPTRPPRRKKKGSRKR